MDQAAKVKLHISGKTYEIDCDSDETILEAALRQDIDAPYSCMSGTCNACQAKVLQGKVEMETCEALTPDEVKSGECLTCQAHPTTPTVELKYPI